MLHFFSIIFIICIVFRSGLTQEWNYYSSTTHNIPSDKITALLIDTDNIKWFGTDSGLVSINNQQIFTHSISDKINYITQNINSNNTELWLSTDNGIISLAVVNADSIEIINTYKKENSGIIDNLCNIVEFDILDLPWIGTYKGLSIFSGEGWINLTESDENLPHNVIKDIKKRTDGYNYIATQGGGVARLKYDGVDAVTAASLIDTEWSLLPSDSINTVYFDTSNTAWYGTNYGLSKHTGTNIKRNWITYTKSQGLVNDTVLTIAGDNSANLWIGTAGGFSVFNGNSWISWVTREHSAGDSVLAIAEDADGSFWLATSNGIVNYKPVINLLPEQIRYNVSSFSLDHYPNPFNSMAIITYLVGRQEHINLKIFNILGEEISTLVNKEQLPGKYSIHFNASNLSSGIYFYRISSSSESITKRMLLIK